MQIHDNSLGSLPGELILKKLRPAYWFSAHLHVKFAALYAHSQTGGVSVANPDEIMIEDSDEDEEDFDVSVKENAMDEMAPPTDNKPTHTQFLALDKILPGRPFLQILDFQDSDSPKEFVYDEEWLAIVKATADGLSLSRSQRPLPSEADLESSVQTSRQWVKEHVSFDTNNMRLPPFIMTAPVDDPTNSTRPVCKTL